MISPSQSLCLTGPFTAATQLSVLLRSFKRAGLNLAALSLDLFCSCWQVGPGCEASPRERVPLEMGRLCISGPVQVLCHAWCVSVAVARSLPVLRGNLGGKNSNFLFADKASLPFEFVLTSATR